MNSVHIRDYKDDHSVGVHSEKNTPAAPGTTAATNGTDGV